MIAPIVIVGNGAAAVHACMALRESGYGGQIRLYSDHAEPPYNPMLTSYYVAGRIGRAECFPFGGRELYDTLGVRARPAVTVARVDALARIVETADGPPVAYSQCLIATGASPVIPPVAGLSGPTVFTLRTMDDADRLRAAVEGGARRALVLGASMVGLKAAEMLRERGLGVVLADVAPQVLPLAADAAAARFVQARMVEAGVHLRLGTGLAGVELLTPSEGTAGGGAAPRPGAPTPLRARFTSGGSVEVDLIVVATGVRPNLEAVDRGQVDCDIGVIVDQHLQASVPGLFAAGDVAQAPSLVSGRPEIVGLWANACLQGRTAGRNMAAAAAGDGRRCRAAGSGPAPGHATAACAAAARSVGVVGPTRSGETETASPLLPEAYPGSLACNITHAFGMTFASVGGPTGRSLVTDCDAAAGVVRHAAGRAACRLKDGGGSAPGEATGTQIPMTSAAATLRVPQLAWAGFCEGLTDNPDLREGA